MKFFRIWNELNMWSKFGLAFVAAVLVILLLLELI